MNAIPADVDADRGPPTAVPLGHFVVGLGFLLAGTVALLTGPAGRGQELATVHLLLAGWVCVTIMGAMTQFVPVWSGVALYSRRLAVRQLWLVTVGLAGLAGAFAAGQTRLAPVAGLVAAVGFWTFVYNVGRTLRQVESLDVTETHFAVALVWFLPVTLLGPLLALDLAVGLFPLSLPLSFPFPVPFPLPGLDAVGHRELLGAHATLAVFGAVLTTVVGALYQLATMFTQTELGRFEAAFQRAETVAYPVGVGALALGRLLSHAPLARVGGIVVAASVVGLGIVLANRLRTTRVDWNPMLSRYAVAAVLAVAWGISAAVGWWTDPLGSLYGDATAGPVLLAGLLGFVVTGTLYHIVPFLVWVREYSDQLGFEPVPLVDDLYESRIARVELGMLVGGGVLVAGASFLGSGIDAATVGHLGAVCLEAGVALFAANVALVVVRHGDVSPRRLLPGTS